MKKILLSILVLSFSTFASDLAKYQEQYQELSKKEKFDYSLKLMGEEESYLKALKIAFEKVKKTGDLEQALVIKAEIENFEKTKKTGLVPKSKQAYLQRIVEKLLKAQANAESAHMQKRLSLMAKYDRVLGKLQKKLVVSSDLESAVEVKKERESLAKEIKSLQSEQPKKIQKIISSSVKKYSDNLIENPSNEKKLRRNQIPSWDLVKGSAWEQLSKSPTAKDGEFCFYPGKGPHHELAQTIDVSKLRYGIDKNNQAFFFEGYISSWKSAKDSGQIIVEYLNKEKKVLGFYDSGKIKTPMQWKKVENISIAPKGTAYIKVRLIAESNEGTNNNGNFDALSLRAVEN